MSNEEFEKQLEKSLKNAPKINDNRSKEDIFNRLKEDGIFDEKIQTAPTKATKKQSSSKVFISIAAAVMVSLIGGYAIKMNDENRMMSDSSGSSVDNEQKIAVEDKQSVEDNVANEGEVSTESSTANMMDQSYSWNRKIYFETEIEPEKVIYYIVKTVTNELIPITIPKRDQWLTGGATIEQQLIDLNSSFIRADLQNDLVLSSLQTYFEKEYVEDMQYLKASQQTYDNVYDAVKAWEIENPLYAQLDGNLFVEDDTVIIQLNISEDYVAEDEIGYLLEELIATVSSFGKSIKFESAPTQIGYIPMNEVLAPISAINLIHPKE